MADLPKLIIAPGPHVRAEDSTARIMWWVSASLLPVFAWAVYLFGLRVLGLLASGVVGALAGEWLACALRRQRPTPGDGSAALTGLLLVGTLSPGLPLWMPAAGGFFAILFGKMLFGGLGHNIFNPALIGRAFLMVTFPVAMTTRWTAPRPGELFPVDVVTQASPLYAWKLEGTIPMNYTELLIGLHSASIGEVSILLLLCGVFLLLGKGLIKLYIPLAVIAGLASVAVWSGAPLFHLLTGGLWFGAFYMATDYVTAPMLPKAQCIFGFGIGVLTGVIRLWGGYPEGICYAILIMNSVTPALNHWFRPARPVYQGVPS